jgi:hypothetical protein
VKPVRIRYVCSNGGRHKQRTLLTFQYQPLPGGGGELVIEESGRGTGGRWGSAAMRTMGGRGLRLRGAPCPNCPTDPTYREDTVRRIGQGFADRGGTCTVDAKTGAIVHKQ